MITFVNNHIANKQINHIFKLTEKGKTSQEIANLFMKNKELNMKKKAVEWEPKDIREIQSNFQAEYKSKKPKKPKNIGSIFLIILITSIFFVLLKPSNKKPKTDSFNKMDALYQCQYAIKRVAKDPENADIPYVPGKQTEKTYGFAWGRDTKFARMRNGLGIDVPATAFCVVDKNLEKIIYLKLNKKTVISRL